MQRAGAWTAVWAPLSLATVAAILKDDGVDVKLVDCIVENVDNPGLARIAADFKPDFALVNTATPSIGTDLSTAKVLKDTNPGIKVACFGIHVTALPEQSLKLAPEMDYVIRGEPEITTRELVRSNFEDISEVAGVSYLQNGSVKHAPDRAPIENLDEIPFPAWDQVDIPRYIMPFTRNPFLLAASGRGCPHPCTFCADTTFYGRTLRLRSPERMVDELEWAGKQFGVREFLFWAESFTLDRNFAISVSEEILRRNLDIKWVSNSRVDDVDGEMLAVMAKAGCWMIGFGMEAGTDRALRLMQKGTTLENAREAVVMSKQAGMQVVAHCVMGYPGETEDDLLQTIKFMKSLPLDFAQFYCAVPFPGSELYETAKREGWINTDDWTMFEQNFSVLDTPELKAERVMELRRRAFKDFYLRPGMFLKVLKRVRSPYDAMNLLRMTRDFLGWI